MIREKLLNGRIIEWEYLGRNSSFFKSLRMLIERPWRAISDVVALKVS